MVGFHMMSSKSQKNYQKMVSNLIRHANSMLPFPAEFSKSFEFSEFEAEAEELLAKEVETFSIALYDVLAGLQLPSNMAAVLSA